MSRQSMPIKTRGILFLESKLTEQPELFSKDTIEAFKAKDVKFQNKAIYANGKVALAVGGGEVPLMKADVERSAGITNLNKGLTLEAGEVAALTGMSLAYGFDAGVGTTADAVIYETTTKTLAAGAYTERIPAIIRNSEVKVYVKGEIVYEGPVKDFFTSNSTEARTQGEVCYIPFSRPALVRENEKIEVKFTAPLNGTALIAGSHFISVSFENARLNSK